MSAFKRKVLHLGGFDPRGARFNHQLLAEQVEHANTLAAAAGEDTRLHLSARRRAGRDALWDVTRSDDAVHSHFHFLAWDDIVRDNWPKGRWLLLGRMIATYWRYGIQGRWRDIKVIPRGSKIALILPGLILARTTALIAVGAGVVLVTLAVLLHWPVALALIVAVVAGLLGGLRQLERSHGAWLLRFVLFNDELARGRCGAEFDLRLDNFAAALGASLEEDWDEVLLVTHSNGSILAMPVMARLLALRGGALPDRFSLVTLGSSIPLVGFRRDAAGFHADLARVAAGQFRWLDIGSKTDGASIPLVNPLLPRHASPPALVQLSPRWHLYCDPATYPQRRADKYLTHFDYLRRLDRPSALDYIGLTCGPCPLAQSIAAFGAENG